MKKKSELSETSSVNQQTETISIYAVPVAVLEARESAYQILSEPSRAHEFARQIIEKLSLAIRAMGREDIGLIAGIGNEPAETETLVENEMPEAGCYEPISVESETDSTINEES